VPRGVLTHVRSERVGESCDNAPRRSGGDAFDWGHECGPLCPALSRWRYGPRAGSPSHSDVPDRPEREHALSREAGQFGDRLAEGVGDALAEQVSESLVSRGGQVADTVGVGPDPRLDHVEELSRAS
jgi:hypothetical protein